MFTKTLLTTFALAFLACIFIALPKPVQANEGRFFLSNVAGGQSECLAYSVEVKLKEYRILITCRGLVYPPQPPELTSYILWADGGELTAPARLANLLFGKGEATIKKRYDQLYVTLERGDKPTKPSGPTIMRGVLTQYDFNPRLTQTEEFNANPPQENLSNQQVEAPQLTITPEPTPAASSTRTPFWQSAFGKLLIIVTAGFLIFIFIIMVYSRKK